MAKTPRERREPRLLPQDVLAGLEFPPGGNASVEDRYAAAFGPPPFSMGPCLHDGVRFALVRLLAASLASGEAVTAEQAVAAGYNAPPVESGVFF
jgi:hypothetical protein